MKLTADYPIEEVRARLAKKINACVGKDGLLRLDVLADAPIEAQSTGSAVIDTWLKSTVSVEPDPADMERRFEFAKTPLESASANRFHAVRPAQA